ncbi:hypothetical protein ACFX14_027521 [Malus domestica]
MDGQCRMETERPLKKPKFIEDEDGKLILVPPPPEELYSCGKLYYVLESHYNAIKAAYRPAKGRWLCLLGNESSFFSGISDDGDTSSGMFSLLFWFLHLLLLFPFVSAYF